MKSTAINISNDKVNVKAILEETQKISAYIGLEKKQEIRLSLLAEELVGLLKALSGNFEGSFVAEVEARNVELITSIFVMDAMDNKTKKSFINVSSEKKNAAAKGIMGKIRDVVENMMYPESAAFSSGYIGSQLGLDAILGEKAADASRESLGAEGVVDALMIGESWSLNHYKNEQRNTEEPWDEIEKSIIANIADDVTVSVKGKNVEIRISKRF